MDSTKSQATITMATITPDLVEWLVADPQVSSSWYMFARLLSLVTNTRNPMMVGSSRCKGTDRQRLKDVLKIWKKVQPDSYMVQTLIYLLDTLVRICQLLE